MATATVPDSYDRFFFQGGGQGFAIFKPETQFL